jgi:lamin tail-like protein
MKLISCIVLVAMVTGPVASAQNRYDVVISEIMADPSPVIGLPNAEWLELRNTTALAVNLQNWRIGDAASQSGPMPLFYLQPDSSVIICGISSLNLLSFFGSVIPVTNFPSLDNEGDQIYLKASTGSIIHAIAYTSSWYRNELKKDGGWTLEIIDIKNPCGSITNWKASIDPIGGTPGKKNSIDGISIDDTSPILKYSYAADSLTIVAVFDEPLDSLKAATISNYIISDGLTIISTITLPPVFYQVQLRLANPMLPGKVYNLTALNVTDCKGNAIVTGKKIKAGIPVYASASELVINEILFNPRTSANDYVEFYNNSKNIFDASALYIANRNSAGVISSIRQISNKAFYIFPGEYIVITQDAENLKLNYLVENPDAVLELSSLPSYPDDEGDVVLLNLQGEVIDEVKYKKNWHFKLISNDEGISLERIDPSGLSTDPSNWHSAASTAGYGTPSYKNSQFRQIESINATVEALPKIFSPDNDGRDDFAIIQYRLGDPGYVANVVVFDANGRVVRYLARNSTLGLNGHWNWDGLGDKGNKLPVGIYIIYTEIYNLQGKIKRFKNTIVLARQL